MSLTLDPKTTALVLIDLQHGTLGMTLGPHPATEVVQNAVALARALDAKGGVIVPVNVAFAANLADRLKQPVDAPTPAPAGGYAPDWGRLVPEIAALPVTVAVTKRQWSAFFGTELDLQLRRRGVGTLVLGGVATNFGVESTARDAWQLNYSVIIAEDACTSVTADAHRFSIEKIMPRIARVRSTPEIVAAIEGTSAAKV